MSGDPVPVVALPAEAIAHRILLIRGQKMLLDTDLAELYGVPTKVLLQAVKRNPARFREISCFSWRTSGRQAQPERLK